MVPPSKFCRFLILFLLLACAAVTPSSEVSVLRAQSPADQHPLRLGQDYFTQKRWPYATLYLEEAVQSEPLLRDYALDLLAETHRAQGLDLDAAKVWGRLIEREPQSLLLQKARRDQAESYLKAHAFRQAYQAFHALRAFARGKRLSKTEKKDLHANLLWGEARALEGMGDQRQAKSRYREIMLRHCDSDVLDAAAQALAASHEPPAENPWTQSSLRRFFSEAEIRTLSRCLLKSGRAELSLLLYQERGEPLYIGQSLYRLRRFDDALKIFESVLKSAGDDKEALFWAAESAGRSDRFQKAKAYYQLFLTKFPRDSRRVKCRFHLAFTLYLEREFEQAAENFSIYAKLYPRDKRAFDAKWYSGWCMYRLNRFSEAIEIWQSMLTWRKSLLPVPEQLHYWIGRALERTSSEAALAAYQSLVAKWPYSFYSPFANTRLAALGAARAEIPDVSFARFPETAEPQLTFSEALRDEKHVPLPMQKAALLSRLGFFSWASAELYRLQPRTRNHRALLELALLFRGVEDYHRSSYIARVNFEDVLLKPFNPARPDEAVKRDLQIWSLAYPRAYRSLVEQSAQYNQLHPSLIWAVMRQESNYKPQAVSKAGAYGLMQLMPETASRMAGMKVTPAELFVPALNIGWGAKYLRILLTDFQGRLDWVAPSYNAGPEQTIAWLKDRADLHPDEFMEEIPFRETRNFVKRVLRIDSIYQMLYPNSLPRKPSPKS